MTSCVMMAEEGDVVMYKQLRQEKCQQSGWEVPNGVLQNGNDVRSRSFIDLSQFLFVARCLKD